MGISTHWVGAGDGGTGRDWGVYLLPKEHSHTIHCGSSYHGLVSGSRAETKDAALAEMVGSYHYIYSKDKSGACGSGYGGIDGDGGVGGR